MRVRLALWLILGALPLGGCTCMDDADGWALSEEFEEEPPPSTQPDGGYVPDAEEQDDLADADTPRENDAGWLPEQIEQDVPMEHALNERTALAVDDAGTIWLGYHACQTQTCDRVDLMLARKPRGGTWSFERVKRQRGTFGIDVAQSERPIMAFLDPTDLTFKVARRQSASQFEFRNLSVRRTGPYDGLDIARDGERMFVTFASHRGDPVALFVHAQNEWRPLDTLDVGNASAAYERGLAADGDGNLFLVHQDGELGPWGIARYSLRDGAWRERTYFQQTPAPRPSSLVVRSNRELCVASDVQNRYLTVTCGDMTNLERERRVFYDEPISSYSSMLEGSDGSLYVAFNASGNTELRLGKRTPDKQWSFETIFEQSSYGVSTVIDSEDLLVISYYTCDSQSCSLEVISRPQH